jgi:chromosome segregation ATPase
VILVFAFVAVLLAAALAIVAITQLGTAAAAQSAATDVRLVRLEIAGLQRDVQASSRLLTDLTAKAQADAAKVAEALKSLSEVDARIQEQIGKASEQQRTQAELGNVVQQQTADTLTRLTERIEALKTEVVPTEAAPPPQNQIADALGRIDRAETDVKALRQAIQEADIPGLRAKVQDLDREVMQAGTDIKALSQASEAFRAQVTRFVQDVFYNDPWSKYTPRGQVPPPQSN